MSFLAYFLKGLLGTVNLTDNNDANTELAFSAFSQTQRSNFRHFELHKCERYIDFILGSR